jgi:hypothetical protein
MASLAADAIPAGFLMPIYAKHTKLTVTNETMPTVQFTTPDSFKQVNDFYESQKKNGWTISDSFNVSDENNAATYKKGTAKYVVRLVRYGSDTMVMIQKQG